MHQTDPFIHLVPTKRKPNLGIDFRLGFWAYSVKRRSVSHSCVNTRIDITIRSEASIRCDREGALLHSHPLPCESFFWIKGIHSGKEDLRDDVVSKRWMVWMGERYWVGLIRVKLGRVFILSPSPMRNAMSSSGAPKIQICMNPYKFVNGKCHTPVN